MSNHNLYPQNENYDFFEFNNSSQQQPQQQPQQQLQPQPQQQDISRPIYYVNRDGGANNSYIAPAIQGGGGGGNYGGNEQNYHIPQEINNNPSQPYSLATNSSNNSNNNNNNNNNSSNNNTNNTLNSNALVTTSSLPHPSASLVKTVKSAFFEHYHLTGNVPTCRINIRPLGGGWSLPSIRESSVIVNAVLKQGCNIFSITEFHNGKLTLMKFSNLYSSLNAVKFLNGFEVSPGCKITVSFATVCSSSAGKWGGGRRKERRKNKLLINFTHFAPFYY